jgi:hypothetical protein
VNLYIDLETFDQRAPFEIALSSVGPAQIHPAHPPRRDRDCRTKENAPMIRSRTAWLFSLALFTVAAMSVGQAQEPQEERVPVLAEGLTIQQAMIHWTKRGDFYFNDADGKSVHVDNTVMLAHPTFYTADEREVPAEIAAGIEIRFFLTESAHYGDLMPDPNPFQLYIDDSGPFEPYSVQIVNPDPHHRTALLTYRVEAADATPQVIMTDETAQLALVAKLGAAPLVLTWNLFAEFTEAPPLDLSRADIIRVTATEGGFTPGLSEFTVGEPIIVVFENNTGVEHHFHAEYLPIADTMRWIFPAEGASYYDDNALRSAAQFDNHVCESEFGYCPTGAWVHLHANPGGIDAIAFVPQSRGIYGVSCPIHADIHATIVVKASRVPHGH